MAEREASSAQQHGSSWHLPMVLHKAGEWVQGEWHRGELLPPRPHPWDWQPGCRACLAISRESVTSACSPPAPFPEERVERPFIHPVLSDSEFSCLDRGVTNACFQEKPWAKHRLRLPCPQPKPGISFCHGADSGGQIQSQNVRERLQSAGGKGCR